MRFWAEVAILAAFAFVVWITMHGLLHGLLDPTWTGYEVLLAAAAVSWIAVRYYRRRRARLRYRLPPR
jgi:divalent metal cation (Fe/Co/Zn/Cd) transporter